MRDGGRERGFAIALLLWMIAGMSLTVAAVIHFARADTGMAELRLREAKARAIGDGVARLLLRDRAMTQYSLEEPATQSEKQLKDGDDDEGPHKTFSKTYRFANGWEVTATLRPSSGFVSLNDGTREEFIMIFSGLGNIEESLAAEIADGALSYRTDFSGFRYIEELLSIPGASRIAYDAVKGFVHPYRSGALLASDAPQALRELSDSVSVDGDEGSGSSRGGGGRQRRRGNSVIGKLTFESIEEAMRNPSGSAAESISAVEMVFSATGNPLVSQRIWVDEALTNPVIRSGPVFTHKAAKGQ